MKCHDLKHQIREYGKEKKISEDYINELEEILNIYDAPVNTGNRVLDLILTEKMILPIDIRDILCSKSIGELQ